MRCTTITILAACASLSLMFACSDADDAPSSQDRAYALTMVSKTHYIIDLPPGTHTPRTIKEGAITWEYRGQAKFPLRKIKPNQHLVTIEPERPLAPDYWVSDLLGSEKIDALGRLWVAIDVDRVVAQRMFDDYNQAVEDTVGLEPPEFINDNNDDFVEASEAVSVDALYYPYSWNQLDCDSDTYPDTSIWDADSRVESLNPLTPRQSKGVRIQIGEGWCSGVMVDDLWVLTAAHCVKDQPVDDMVVCTHGNYQSPTSCSHVVTSVVQWKWNETTNKMKHDYAVIKLNDPLGVGWMPISQASNSTLEQHTSHNTGYPGHFKGPNCSSTYKTPVQSTYIIPTTPFLNFKDLNASEQNYSTGQLFNATTNLVKTRVDLASGHSGGPFYYYPHGCCGSHYITGVVSGYVNPFLGLKYNGGPKGPKIRNWVIASTP